MKELIASGCGNRTFKGAGRLIDGVLQRQEKRSTKAKTRFELPFSSNSAKRTAMKLVQNSKDLNFTEFTTGSLHMKDKG
jgi:hypothetical protein